ncbi:MAG: hypothetical protein FJ249_06720 [Nitrospira sp.]|nr:hypothetical protein [Nitrospira sp.]
MKEKLSVTVDQPLVRFLDSLPGQSRSEKLERVLRRFQEVSEDLTLRRALAKHKEPEDEQRGHAALIELMEEAMWREE